MNIKGFERAVLYACGGAFLLSLFIGILSGNPVGVAVARAFVSALVFGALVFACVLILKKYIPDIDTMALTVGERGEPEDRDASGEERGRTVDYTVEGGLPQDLLGPDGEGERTGAEGLERSAERAGSAGSLVNGERPASARQPDADRVSSRQDLEETLPSLDSLFESDDDEKVPSETPHFEEARTERKPDGDYISIGDTRIPNEPEVMAKAIKRLMKQDG